MGINAMHVAKTGLNAQQVRMQIISNNLANVNTNGFKRDRANFESLLYQIIRSSGAQTSVDTELTSGFSVGTGVNIVSANKMHSQGSIISTDNSLDLAIDGTGFFRANVNENVSPRLKFWDEVEEFPAIHLNSGSETREYQAGGYKDRFLSITIRCYVKDEDSVDVLDELLEDVETVIEENSQ